MLHAGRASFNQQTVSAFAFWGMSEFQPASAVALDESLSIIAHKPPRSMTTLRIEQGPPQDGKYPITLRHLVDGVQKRTATATIEFALSDQEQEELRWYLEDYLQKAAVIEAEVVQQVTDMIRQRGIELYQKVFTANANTQAVWFAVRDQLADLRIEISTGIAEAASIPWELIRDPELDSAIALRVKAFVRVQSDPNIAFIDVPPLDDSGRLRLLYIVCRPSGSRDVPLRALVNRILQDLGPDRDRFDITALRPPTFEQLQLALGKAKAEGRPYHIVHFDGHGMYDDLGEDTELSDWLASISSLVLGGPKKGKHGYLLFEHPSSESKMRPVDGHALGQLLHDHGSPVLVLNACQSAMHEAQAAPSPDASVHEEIRAIGSLSQAVIDCGVPAVLGMRYSVYVVTAAQYIGELYRSLAQGQSFGEAASTGRKHLFHNPERWLGLQPQTLQDWCVPVVHEAMPIALLPPGKGGLKLSGDEDRDPVLASAILRRYVPESGFIGRDETLLALDRGFDQHRIVLLHAYAGQGKSSTAVEFARWYALTGGLGPQPIVLFSSFEQHLDLASLLNQLATPFLPVLEANDIHWHALNKPDERRALVLQLLRQIPVLWIWDNVEPVAGFPAGTPSQWTAAEQEELRDFLKQIAIDTRSQVKLLLTSRRDEQGWLGQLPHRVKMPRMSAADAATLAQQLGEKSQITRSEVADWQPLLNYCQGNPLTLRVLVGQALRMGLRGEAQLAAFTDAIRSGEQAIQDTDEKEGRTRSLGASLAYGFKHAFQDDELPIIALLHLFQGTVDVDALELMGESKHALPEVQGRSKEQLTSLLHRASEIGLLTHMGETWFRIHPALPWFLHQLFARHYDGQPGRSTARAAQCAWVDALGALGDHYCNLFVNGEPDVIALLELEEANLLAARRFARRQQRWELVTSAMQGLKMLYDYQGRSAEWVRLVEEIMPDYCSPDDKPLPGREDGYDLVMSYRVFIAKDVDRDPALAMSLQTKLVALSRQRAAAALSLPAEQEVPLVQRNVVRSLAVTLTTLGQLQHNAEEASCVTQFQEASHLCERISNATTQAVAEFNLGHAYMSLRSVRDLQAAEASYQRSLDLRAPQDSLGRAKCSLAIAAVHHLRFTEARAANGPETDLLRHANTALQHYQQALARCPQTAHTIIGPIHHQLGSLMADVCRWDEARDHYEQAVQCFEATGDRHRAGQTRFNIANMYLLASTHQPQPSGQRDYLHRAQAYAQAALRDFQHYEGRAVVDEAKAQGLLNIIAQELQALPG